VEVKPTLDLLDVALYSTSNVDRRTLVSQHRSHHIRTTGGTMEILKVSARSNPNSVAGALAGVIREQGAAELQTVGAGALNQAVKAIAIARGFLAPTGTDLSCVPSFADIEINGEERTAIRILVEPRPTRC
jgi:stage V sporulation protein S